MRPVLPRFLIAGALVFLTSVGILGAPVNEARAVRLDLGFVVDTEDGQITIVVAGDPDESDGMPSWQRPANELNRQANKSSNSGKTSTVTQETSIWVRVGRQILDLCRR